LGRKLVVNGLGSKGGLAHHILIKDTLKVSFIFLIRYLLKLNKD